MKRLFAVALVALALAAFARAHVVVLTPENFDDFVGSSEKMVFVKFYAQWCGHCKHLAPDWIKLGEAFENDKSVVIAEVDADTHREIGNRFNVRGFPTIKWFPRGSKEGEDYRGDRSADALIKFVNEKTGGRATMKKEVKNVVAVDTATFDKLVQDNSKNVLMKFYAPWCTHCKSLAPVYERVAGAFKREPSCVMAEIDADGNREVGDRYGVSGFPTIKFFGKDNKQGEDYEGGRTEDALLSFMNAKCGTYRTIDGGLTEQAGRVAALDTLAQKFMADADAAAREVTIADAEKFVAENPDDKNAKYYVAVMRKALGKGPAPGEYVDAELQRVSRLAEGKQVTPAKLDEFAVKRNILRAFTVAK